MLLQANHFLHAGHLLYHLKHSLNDTLGIDLFMAHHCAVKDVGMDGHVQLSLEHILHQVLHNLFRFPFPCQKRLFHLLYFITVANISVSCSPVPTQTFTRLPIGAMCCVFFSSSRLV